MSNYTYGDTEAAFRRLLLLARLYEPTSRDFMSEFAGEPVGTAADLGCGPGQTTRLLGEVFAPARLVAADRSGRFLGEARRATPQAEFFEHDVTVVPFPWGTASRSYCRFVLGHLTRPLDVIDAWVGALEPGGVMLAEEYEWIRSAHPVAARYLAAAEAMVLSGGATLRIGPELANLVEIGAGEVLMNRETSFDPDPSLLAEVFLLNLPAMRASQARQGLPEDGEIDHLAEELSDFATSGDRVTVAVRQIAIRRVSN